MITEQDMEREGTDAIIRMNNKIPLFERENRELRGEIMALEKDMARLVILLRRVTTLSLRYDDPYHFRVVFDGVCSEFAAIDAAP